MSIEKTMSNLKFGNFKVGDTVRALKEIHFMYGDIHLKGALYNITADTLDYYDVMHKDYKLVIKEVSHANTNKSR